MSTQKDSGLLDHIKSSLRARYPTLLKSHAGTATLSLMAIGLTGCGGGGGGANLNTSTLGGTAVKGPLANALVFVDLDGDGQLDSDEISSTTNSDGSYTLSSTDASKLDGEIIVQTNENTIDSSSGEVLSGLTLSAPSGSQVVSPLTTLINDVVGAQGSDESDAAYQARIDSELLTPLGISQSIDVTTFNPFDTDDLASAKAVETAAQQITAIVNTIAKAMEAAGKDGESAANQALDAVATQISNGAALTSSSTIENILDAVDTDDVINSTNTTDIAAAIRNVANTIATEVDNVDTLAEARDIFALAQTTLAEAAASATSGASGALLGELGNTGNDLSQYASNRVDVGGDTDVTIEENDIDGGSLTASGALTLPTDSENSAITYQINANSVTPLGSPSGTLTVDSNGEWVYTLSDASSLDALQDPDNRGALEGTGNEFKVTEQFVVTIQKVDVTDPANPVTSTATYSDGGSAITKIITINITGNNDAPVAEDVTGIVLGDASTLVIDKDFLAEQISDVDNTDDQLAITDIEVTSGPGSISVVDGNYVYTPSQVDANTNVVLTYTLSDGFAIDTGTLTISVVDTIALGAIDEDGIGTLANLKAAAASELGIEASSIELALASAPDTILTEDYSPAANFNGTVDFVVKRAGEDDLPASLTVTAANDPATGTVSISGVAFESNTLTADTTGISDVDGISNATFSYQWKADGVEIDGATSATFTPESAQIGAEISVDVSFTDDEGFEESLTSAGTDSVGGIDTPRLDKNTSNGAAVATINDLPAGATTNITAVTQTFRDVQLGGLRDENDDPLDPIDLFNINSSNQITFNDAGNVGFEQSDYVVTVEVTAGNETFSIDVDLDSNPLRLIMGADVGDQGTEGSDTLEGSLVANFATASRVVETNGDLTFVDSLSGNTISMRKEQDNPNTSFDSIAITESDSGTLVAQISGFSLTESAAKALFQSVSNAEGDFFFTSAAKTLFAANDFDVSVEEGLSGGILSGPDNGSFVKFTGSSGNDTFVLQNNSTNGGENGAMDLITGGGDDQVLVLLDGENQVLGDVLVTDFTAGSDTIQFVVSTDLFADSQIKFTEVTEAGATRTEISFDLDGNGSTTDSDEQGFGTINLIGATQSQAQAAVSVVDEEFNPTSLDFI